MPECIRTRLGKGAVFMLHIALCGIPHQDRELLDMLQAYPPQSQEAPPGMTHFPSAGQLLAGLEIGCFDLVLISLSLPDMDGMDLAHRMRQKGLQIPVVFLADGPERAMEAYRAGALQYLVRPLEQPLLYHALEIAARLGAGREGPGLRVNTPAGLRLVQPGEVRYVECVGHVLEIHTTSQELIRSRNIRVPFARALAPLLQDHRFLQPHKSFVVNMEEITGLAPEGLSLRAEKLVIPVPRSRFAEVKIAYTAYLETKPVVSARQPQRYRVCSK